MRIRIKVPKIGLTIEEVTLTWERNVGDQIAAEEVIAVMEADKATYELTAPAAGILVEQLAAPGAVVSIGTEVAVIQT